MADLGQRLDSFAVKIAKKQIEVDSSRLRIKQIQLRLLEMEVDKESLLAEIENREKGIMVMEEEIVVLRGGEK